MAHQRQSILRPVSALQKRRDKQTFTRNRENLDGLIDLLEVDSQASTDKAPNKHAEMLKKYNEICNQNKLALLEEVCLALSEGEFLLNISRLTHSNNGFGDKLDFMLQLFKSFNFWNGIKIVDETSDRKPVTAAHKKYLKLAEANRSHLLRRIQKALQSHIPKQTELRSFCLYGLKPQTWEGWFESFKKLRTLHVIDIRDCNLGSTGVALLLRNCKDNQVKKFRLVGCGLKGKEACHELKQFLVTQEQARCTSDFKAMLREQDADIQSEGLIALDLSYNALGDLGVKKICEALQSGKWVMWIAMRSNNISKKGLKEILRTLQSNFSIIHFDINDNPKLSRAVVQGLEVHLEKRKSAIAESVDLPENEFWQPIERVQTEWQKSEKLIHDKNKVYKKRGRFATGSKEVYKVCKKRPTSALGKRSRSRTQDYDIISEITEPDIPISRGTETSTQRENIIGLQSAIGTINEPPSTVKTAPTLVDSSQNLINYLESTFKRLHSFMDAQKK